LKRKLRHTQINKAVTPINPAKTTSVDTNRAATNPFTRSAAQRTAKTRRFVTLHKSRCAHNVDSSRETLAVSANDAVLHVVPLVSGCFIIVLHSTGTHVNRKFRGKRTKTAFRHRIGRLIALVTWYEPGDGLSVGQRAFACRRGSQRCCRQANDAPVAAPCIGQAIGNYCDRLWCGHAPFALTQTESGVSRQSRSPTWARIHAV